MAPATPHVAVLQAQCWVYVQYGSSVRGSLGLGNESTGLCSLQLPSHCLQEAETCNQQHPAQLKLQVVSCATAQAVFPWLTLWGTFPCDTTSQVCCHRYSQPVSRVLSSCCSTGAAPGKGKAQHCLAPAGRACGTACQRAPAQVTGAQAAPAGALPDLFHRMQDSV